MIGKYRFSSLQILVIGFAVLIGIGAVLLSLPISNRSGVGLSLIDSLFTSTSATCVTGLVVLDTYTQFTFFGQVVILTLIQIGGLGFMMVAFMFSLFMGRRIGLRERAIMMESVSALKLGGIVRMVKKVLIITAIFELSGAAILATRFCPQFGVLPGIWCSIFHSVSAFCNAGFDIMGRMAPFTSMTSYAGDFTINITLMTLIVGGGIGFFVWDDVTNKKWHFSKYQLHTKIMLSATLFLIVISTVLFYFLEKNHALNNMSVGQQIISSFFHSITPRTAGFNTIPMTSLSEGSTLLSMVLMIIGAGPGSTGGGLKVTTITVIFLAVVARARSREDLNIFGRRLEDSALKRASTSAGLYLSLSLIGAIIICSQGFAVRDSLFETLSAIGTVGLSTGITPNLPALSQIVVMLLMYTGRVGSLSVAMAVAERKNKAQLKNVTEKIIIG